MIAVKLRIDAFEKLREVYPHLQDSFKGFRNLAPYLGRVVYVQTQDLSQVGKICDQHGTDLIQGGKVGVAVIPIVLNRNLNDYL
jgi:hypothetical protein